MRIAFYIAKHGTLLDKLIGMWAFSKYSHCEINIFKNVCVSSSSRDGGVRIKEIDFDYKWDVFDIDDSIDFPSVFRFASANLGCKYDYAGIIMTQIFGLVIPFNHRWFCSDFCYEALRKGGLKSRIWRTKVHPKLLYKILKKKSIIQ